MKQRLKQILLLLSLSPKMSVAINTPIPRLSARNSSKIYQYAKFFANDELYCPNCLTDLKPIGKKVVREELEYIPAKVQIVRYVRMAYEYPKCKHSDHPYIEKALTPTSLMNHSLASPSSVANVMYQKYVNAVPLYRQEKNLENIGISLSRATMANWVIRCTQD